MIKLTYTELTQSIKAFIPNNPEIISIIKFCKLKSTGDWKVWSDGAGNQLIINNNKEVSININKDASVLTNNIIDIYFKSNIRTISKNSTYASIGLCDDMETYLFWFKGKDNLLRFLIYKNGSCNHFFPLVSGIDALRFFFMNDDVLKKGEIDFCNSILPWEIYYPYNLTIKKTWATLWPPSNSLIQNLSMKNDEKSVEMINLLEL